MGADPRELSFRLHIPAKSLRSLYIYNFNTWRPGYIKPMPAERYRPELAKPFLDIMEQLIPDEAERTQLLRWCATLVARPEIKMHFGVLLISETQGVGKSTLGEAILAELVGLHNVSFPSESSIVDSSFNSWAAQKRLAVVHEIYAGHGFKAGSRLKSVATDKYTEINRKYLAEYRISNYLHIFACSNSLKAIAIDDDTNERRWFIPRVTEEVRPQAYWAGFNRWLTEEQGLEIILRWAEEFLKVHQPVMPGERPMMTDMKREVVEESRSPGERLAHDLARMVVEEGRRAVFKMSDVRLYVANRLCGGNVARAESERRLKKVMVAAGMREVPKVKGQESRIKVAGVYQTVVATFDLEPGVTWSSIRESYKTPDQVVSAIEPI
jgi:hypothetical protein